MESTAGLQQLARRVYWGYHKGWANGYWHGYHDGNAWGWGRFATGAAVGVTAWALGSSFYNWGYGGGYANPYYADAAVPQPIIIEQVSAGGEPQAVSIPALAYDYSQPIDTQAAPPPAEVADPAVAKFDAARQAFHDADYAGALRLTDEALKVLPNDATLHEFRALVLFAAGKYDLASGPLYAVLSVGPGWDWTTMIGLYSSADIYTAQLRKLEAFVKADPNSASGRFVLAYHYPPLPKWKVYR
jgi:tetratricopeptide (TPR) repeat protein